MNTVSKDDLFKTLASVITLCCLEFSDSESEGVESIFSGVLEGRLDFEEVKRVRLHAL